ncbi:16S rRNA (cytidine(1402)-2'-O)-methyltransferase [Paracoccus sp. S-4012]|uniref:16S rRNA (cytidine(1402)-2'-O)-methyltransferase n=1 Tax=Paracoccus sp. S-4012 TaxID=2665648 RepID=UPI0012AF4AFF|nr:16S rRNA (cytidine(1402)-2'-O)-methyltransferase [Paracoccus sp. S-4012]MRX49582.1 16S rRNA (cytidine(1402)-2'-O)-methyltransferase [Paracoccus sp. S-4012]
MTVPRPAEDAAAVTLTLKREAPEPGLYLLAMPIGAARDITLRALDLLNTADVLAAEDTRTLRHLMTIHGIPLRGRRILACHDHNEAAAAAGLLAALAEGRTVAYASEAGTPSVSDPGFRLARDAAGAGYRVNAVPGPSAVLAALVASGMPSDRFLFAGFAPAARAARRRWLEELLAVEATVIIFENPRRVKDLFADLCDIDSERESAICRELTKKFEEVRRGTVRDLAGPELDGLRGEVVVLVDRSRSGAGGGDAEAMISAALEEGLSVRDAAARVAAALGRPRRELYQLALAMAGGAAAKDEGEDSGDADGTG